MNKRGRLVLGVVLVLGLSSLAMLLAGSAEPGTDDQAAGAIEALSGGTYEPWAKTPGVPGGEQNGPLLVGVQAGAGLIVLAGCLWYWRESRSEA